MFLWGEIRRRNVHRVAIAYVAAAWLLIQVAETLFPVFRLPDMAIRAVVIVLAIGFVPAVILSWVFEWTPDGFQRDHEVTVPAPAARTRRFDAAIIVLLALAVAYFAVDKFVLDPSRDAAERAVARQEGRADALVDSYGGRSIVVLPFVNISSDPEQEYLGDGLAEELLNLLAGVEGLRVISRTSAFSFKGKEITSAEIARLLNVSYVLEGSVRKSGNALRITAQLIDARADAHVWSDTYDHATENIFDIQDSVAAEVVGNLKTELSLEPPKAERHDPDAYALYLRARLLSNRHGTANTQRELLEHALELEPDYLDARSLLAWSYRRSSVSAAQDGDIEAASRHDEKYDLLVDKVLAQDPGHPGANALRAWEMLSMSDLRQAAMYAERALESEPTHSDALTTAGEILKRLWRADHAIPILRYATERDPLTAYHFENIAGAYLNAGQYASAEGALHTARVLAPGDQFWTEWGIGLALLLQGKASEALRYFDENIGDMPLRWHGKALALHALGRADDAQAELAKLLEVDPGTPNIHWFIGTAHAWIGETDKAFTSFEKQREEGLIVFTNMGDSPLYANLNDDSRWQPLLASVGLSPDFLASIEFNPRLPAEIQLRKNANTR
jgi:TolB-like protein/Flp pilus assembly protein TadD